MHSSSTLNLWVYSILSSLLLLSLPMSTSALTCLSSHCYCALRSHYTLVPLKIFVGHVQTISTGVGQAFSSICAIPSLSYIYIYIYIVSDSIPSCMVIYPMQHTHFRNTYMLNMSAFSRQTFCTIQHSIQHSRSNHRPTKSAFLASMIPFCHIERKCLTSLHPPCF
jgi:hypothetical protein